MRSNLLRLDEDRILVEQLRLLLRNASSSVIPVILLIFLLLWVLLNNSNTTGLLTWAVVVIVSRLNGYRYLRIHPADSILSDRAHHMVWMLVLMNGVDGMLWGALTWVTIGASTLAGSILVISVIACFAGGAMSVLSPVLPVFVAFVIPELGAVAWKMWLLGEPAYNVLGVVIALYIATLISQASNSSRAVRAAIELRFENIALLEQLRIETGIAETAQCQAEHANQAKSRFLAAASHDLRQPIHAQGLFLEVLARTELSVTQRDLLANARAALDASSEMLNTLLDFSRIEAGVVVPQLQPFRLQHLFNKIENELAPQADEKGIVYRTRETHLILQSDPALVELILRNLVSNAIRYTERGGLLVACRRHGKQAVLEVWDTGVGIAREQQQAVFREFHQLGNPERDRRKGLGLGLAIAEGLARTLGHELSLVSTPQRGSVFRLTLPIASVSRIDERRLKSRQDKIQVINARVLVIDDDKAVLEGMYHLLRDWGCECDQAETIEQALELAQANTPDVVISDYRLRQQSTGVEAIIRLRKLLGNTLPALLITGDTAPERLREAQASGITLLHKPVSPHKLYRALAEVREAAVNAAVS